MIKRKSIIRKITSEDYLDITLLFDKGKIIKFALNYRALIKEKIQPIYRVDNYHNFLHEQRLWRTESPIKLDEAGLTNNQIVEKYVDLIYQNFQKYKEYYKRSQKNEKTNKKRTKKKS